MKTQAQQDTKAMKKYLKAAAQTDRKIAKLRRAGRNLSVTHVLFAADGHQDIIIDV